MKRILRILMTAAALVALVGCSDEARLQRCVQKAAGHPTSEGVGVGTRSCYNRFSARDQNRESGEQLFRLRVHPDFLSLGVPRDPSVIA